VLFAGESIHALDAKNRVFVPKRFQEQLERDAQGSLRIVLTRGFDRCLFLFSAGAFAHVLERLRLQPFAGEELRVMQRLFFANTHETSLDASGRLVIPEKLRTYAGIASEVAMIGCADRAEIWERATWEAYEASRSAQFDALAAVLTGDASIRSPSG
jgi:MraZ protein